MRTLLTRLSHGELLRYRLVSIAPITPMAALNEVNDTVAPYLTGATLDLNHGYLRLNFSEVGAELSTIASAE